jgi:hypothetical protein
MGCWRTQKKNILNEELSGKLLLVSARSDAR